MKNEEYTYLGGLTHAVGSLLIGMKTSIKVYFRKKVTEQYPENRKELKMFDRFRGTLTMPHNAANEHHCIACGLCQNACPNDTLRVISETIETEDGMNMIWARASFASSVSTLVRMTPLRSTRILNMPFSTVQNLC